MGAPAFHITVLGSGTSSGVPTIGCKCEVCLSTDPRDKRTRPSILVQYEGRNVIIDTTPDFRAQVLRAGIERLDAILYTHAHADHILGLDDVRPFNYRQKGSIPIYATEDTLCVLRRVFEYAFAESPESTVPKLDLRVMEDAPFDLFGVTFEPIRLDHGKGRVFGFRFGRVAYLTDHSAIPEGSMAKLQGLEVLFLDALRHRPHPTHTTVEQAVRHAEELQAKRVFFTHMCHDLGHEKTEVSLPRHIRLAYDGLEITVEAERSRVARSLHDTAGFGPSAVAIGVFDGVHTGHQALLNATVDAARELGVKPTVLTFDPHPACVVAPDRAPRLLYSVEERCRLLEQYGIEQILVLPFTQEIAQLSPEDFAGGILEVGLHPRAVIVGETFRFGYKQSGDVTALREFGARTDFDLRAIPAVRRRGVVVSSSEIRKMIENGAVSKSGRLLGRPYALTGDVVKGHGIGHKQTVPTLNLSTSAEVLPLRGVYITRTSDLEDGRRWNSITNVGVRPTFGSDVTMSIETFLLSPFSEPTPSRIKLEFLRRVRDERKFESPEALKSQILRDVGRAQTFFRRWGAGPRPAAAS